MISHDACLQENDEYITGAYEEAAIFLTQAGWRSYAQ